MACLCLIVLAGCASTRSSAPIREQPCAAGKRPHSNTQAYKPELPVAAGYYRVQPGDTLYKIAFEQGQDYRELALWNNLAAPGRIRSGDVLRVVPPKPAVTARALGNSPGVDAKPPAKLPAAAAQSPPAHSGVAASPPAAAEETAPNTWSWPLRGPVLARFGEGLNKGIDIAGPRGMLVQAAASGRVVYAGSGLRGYGKLIIIRHGKTLLSAYAHTARILVAEGQNVVRGQAVGEIGDSDADRVKLHFEIREFGKPVDPMIYLPNAG